MNEKSIYKSEAGRQAVMALYDDMLAQWPVPYEPLTVATRHGETFVIGCGAPGAPVLVLLHGAGSNSAIWRGDIGSFSRTYRVYAVDLIGEPGKSAPNRPKWDSPAFADWLTDVLDGLGVNRATLCGMSQGGWTALKFAVAAPERVERLVLLCPGGVVGDRASFLPRALPLLLLGQWGARRMTRMMFGDQPLPDGVEEITTMVTSNFNSRIGVVPLFSDDDLCRLTMPTLLIGGGKDVIRDNEKIAERLRALLPDVEVIILPHAGHALLDVTNLIADFLASTFTSAFT